MKGWSTFTTDEGGEAFLGAEQGFGLADVGVGEPAIARLRHGVAGGETRACGRGHLRRRPDRFGCFGYRDCGPEGLGGPRYLLTPSLATSFPRLVPLRLRVTLVVSLSAAAALSGSTVSAQIHTPPAGELPNPYRPFENHFKLAEGRWWGSTSAVDIDIDGQSIWVAERCAANSCAGSKLNPVLHFDASGRLRRRFGEGMFIFPNGIHVDGKGDVWVTDAQGPDGQDPDRDGKGHAVYKFSPTGRLLLTLGTPGVAGDGTGALLNGPSDIVTAPNGDIFVTDGAGGVDADAPPSTVARIVKYTKDGTFITAWGTLGSGPGELRTPQGLALDSRGRLFVADRGNAPHPDFRPGGTVPRCMAAVWWGDRNLHRPEWPTLRGRSGVERLQRGLGKGHSDRKRPRWHGDVLYPGLRGAADRNGWGGGRSRGWAGQRVWRQRRPGDPSAGADEVREVTTGLEDPYGLADGTPERDNAEIVAETDFTRVEPIVACPHAIGRSA